MQPWPEPATLAYLCMAASARKAEAERVCRNLKPIYRNSELDPALAHSMMEYCPQLFMQ